MTEPLTRLAQTVSSNLRAFGTPPVSLTVIKRLLSLAYLASMRTEEGRFVRGSLTYANPSQPDLHPPLTRRNDYPAFTPFRSPVPLTEISIVKLARAVDRWSGSIAVWSSTSTHLVAWGIVDQLVETNINLNREGSSGFAHPGILTVTMDAVAELSVYHGHTLLARLRSHEVIVRENDALQSSQVTKHVLPYFEPIATAMARVLGVPRRSREIAAHLLWGWSNTIARICIGLRRLGTGGSLVLTPSPVFGALSLGNELSYRRLEEAVALLVLDEWHLASLRRRRWARWRASTLPSDLITDLDFAEGDQRDRESQLSGAV